MFLHVRLLTDMSEIVLLKCVSAASLLYEAASQTECKLPLCTFYTVIPGHPSSLIAYMCECVGTSLVLVLVSKIATTTGANSYTLLKLSQESTHRHVHTRSHLLSPHYSRNRSAAHRLEMGKDRKT